MKSSSQQHYRARATTKQQNPVTPYTPAEFAQEAFKAHKAGAAMVHVHARGDDGVPTHDIARIRATYDAIKQKCPDLIVNLSTAVGMGKTPEQRIDQIVEVKPEMASLNTNSMNFAAIDRKTGEILVDYIFDNSFTMIRDFAIKMESNGVNQKSKSTILAGWIIFCY